MVHKQWLKVWFLISQMPILSGRINFVPFSTTSNFCFPKIPMKYSKNGQKFAMSKNPSNMLFNTCWTPCKKPHVSTRSRSWYTFFWITPYHIETKVYWNHQYVLSIKRRQNLPFRYRLWWRLEFLHWPVHFPNKLPLLTTLRRCALDKSGKWKWPFKILVRNSVCLSERTIVSMKEKTR